MLNCHVCKQGIIDNIFCN